MVSYSMLICMLCLTSTQAQKDILSPPYTCTTTTTLCQPGKTTEHATSTLRTSTSQGRPGKRGMNGLPGIKGEKGEPCQCDIVDEQTIQRRQDGSVRFYDRNWESYARGFGDKNGEFWLGLRTIHQLTTSRYYKLRIDMRFQSGSVKYAEYSTFKVGNENSKFQLTISGYFGDALNMMLQHNNQYFSTYDVDNDSDSRNCARSYNGAWWYTSCYHSNLNGKYDSDFIWRSSTLSFSEMKIHPV
uniref:ryncolin-1-like n=1 Tax=Styela clava TaxID=7725 RepID=UPI00193A07B6|nr:ryncolin-1-like [Styela clava]